MSKIKLCLCILAIGQFSSLAIGAAVGDCVPNFIEKNKKFYIDTGAKEIRIKVLNIDENSCWISVKEILPKGANASHFTKKKTAPFWLNLNNVMVVRKHSEERQLPLNRSIK